jgi:hypothetical protein
VVFLFVRRLKNFKTAAAGLILHLSAAIAFAAEHDVFVYGEGAFRSVRFIGSFVIALSALVMAFIRKVWFNTPPQTCLPQICALCGGSNKATPTKIWY